MKGKELHAILRERSNLSYAEIARAIGIRPQSFWRMLHSDYHVKSDVLEKVCEVHRWKMNVLYPDMAPPMFNDLLELLITYNKNLSEVLQKYASQV